MRHEATAPFRLPQLFRGAIAQQQLRTGVALTVIQDQQVVDLVGLDYVGNQDKVITVNPAGTGLELATPIDALGLTKDVQSSEIIVASNLCNIYTSAGAARVRKANATDTTKPANAFAPFGGASGALITLAFVGQIISGLAGLTPGTTYFLDTTGGGITSVPPSGDGNGVQEVGIAFSATTLLFHPKTMIGL